MSRVLFTIGRRCAHRPLLTIASWIVLAALVIAASSLFGGRLDDGFGVPGSDSDTAGRMLERGRSGDAGLTAQVALTPRSDRRTFASPRVALAATGVRDRLAALPNVVSASDPTQAISPNGRVSLIRLQYPPVDELNAGDLARLKAAVETARAGAEGRLLRIEAAGELFFTFEEPEGGPGELVGVGVAAIILLVAFGSLIAMGLPIVVALVGLGLGLGSMPLVTYVIPIPSWSSVLAAMVGLGVGIDYALLMVSRHREHLAQGMAVDESIARTTATAGRSVVFAGGTVLVSILGLAVAGLPFVTAAGVAIAVVVLLMVSASVTLLPALLGASGRWIDRLSIHRRGRTGSPGAGRWERWAGHVTRHAWPYAIAACLLLGAAAAPALALRLGTPDDGTLPQTRSERRAYDLVASGFGPGANGPLLVAIDTRGDSTAIARVRAALAADRGVASVTAPSGPTRSGVASLVAIPTTAPQQEATRSTLVRIRSEVIPTALAGSHARAAVGGQTASFVDTSDRVTSRLFAFIAAVVGLSVLLLVAVFRSVVVALKAAALNLLSIGAAYGVMVMVFQWQWGASLIGVHSAVPIVSFIPMFMFAIVFGLSMDYEVFLLSRIREHYVAHGDNARAIVHGLAATGRVITSAALIMVSVFLGFVAGNDPSTKMFGLGLATAILIDATLVRMVLLPATMALLGRANWWLPAWLERRIGNGRPAAPSTTRGWQDPA